MEQTDTDEKVEVSVELTPSKPNYEYYQKKSFIIRLREKLLKKCQCMTDISDDTFSSDKKLDDFNHFNVFTNESHHKILFGCNCVEIMIGAKNSHFFGVYKIFTVGLNGDQVIDQLIDFFKYRSQISKEIESDIRQQIEREFYETHRRFQYSRFVEKTLDFSDVIEWWFDVEHGYSYRCSFIFAENLYSLDVPSGVYQTKDPIQLHEICKKYQAPDKVKFMIGIFD